MLRIENLTLTLDNGRKLTDGLNLTLERGDKYAVIGEEGDGKSTLLEYIFDPTAVAHIRASGNVVKRGTVGYLAQFINKTDAQKTVFEYVGDDFYGAIEYADRLRLPVELLYSDRRMGSLSGGERVKVELFKLLADDPDILLLDEPTNDLDVDALDALETIILETQKPTLFVSHDVTLLSRAANGIVHLEQLKRKTECRTTVAALGYSDYVEARERGMARQTQIAQKQRDEYAAKLRRWQHIYDRVDHEQKTISRSDPGGGRLLKKKMKSVLSQRRRFEREKEDFEEIPDTEDAIITRFPESAALPRGKTVIELDIPELFAGDKLIARDVKLNVTGAEKIAIVGANGAGKSTLVKEIAARLATRTDVRCTYMPQNYAETLSGDTPLDFLDTIKNVDLTYARQLLGNMRFTPAEMTGSISALSGGQRAKLIFLRAVLDESNVLVLDEPTRNFSPLSVPAVCAALGDFKGCIISVSHDRKYIDAVCDAVYELTPRGLMRKR